MEPVTLAFSSNDGHAMLLGVALCSIFENKRGDYPIQVFVMDGGISEKNKGRLKILEQRYCFDIKYVTPDPKLFAGISTEWRPLPAYYRVAIGDLLPAECRKVLYCDCDVIMRHDISELFHVDLEGETVAAVPDCPQDWWKDHLEKLCKQLSIEAPEDLWYFNSGILLIDLELWRKKEIGPKLLRFIRENPDKLWVADQDPLNIILLREKKKISTKYNFSPVPYNPIKEDDPAIVHFSGGIKPWYILSALPFQPEYLYYANKTPWRYKKYRKFMDTAFAKKYHIYPVSWWMWSCYKNIRGFFTKKKI